MERTPLFFPGKKEVSHLQTTQQRMKDVPNEDAGAQSHALCSQAAGRLKQEDQEFKVSLGYTVSSKLAWAT